MMSSNSLLRCVLLSAMLLPATALAQSRNTDADRLYNEGLALYQDGEFEEALTRYRAAYALDPAHDIWSNIIFCLKDLGQEVVVISEYDAHVVEYWPKLSESSRKQIMDYMLHVGGIAGFGFVELDVPKAGVMFVDAKLRGPKSAHIPLRLPTGKHVVRLEAPGMAPTEETVDVRSGERSTTKLSPRKPLYVDVRLGLIGGGTTTIGGLSEGTNCGVYCFPTLNVLLGARLTIPIRGPFVAEIGGDYLHTYSELNHDWKGVGPLESQFSLHAAIAHASLGIDVMRGRLRFQSRIGAGVLSGQSDEDVVGKDATIWTASGPLATLHARLGLSVEHRGVRFGFGVEGLTTTTAHMEAKEVPAVEGVPLVSLNDVDPVKNPRAFGRLVVVLPEVSVGLSF